MDGVVKLVLPEANGEPPVAAAYQSTVFPLATVAVRLRVPAEDLDEPLDPVMVGKVVIEVAVKASEPLLTFAKKKFKFPELEFEPM